MSSKRARVAAVAAVKKADVAAIPAIQPDAAFSFLKDTKGVVSWHERDLAKTLNLSPRDAKLVAALLEAQGYIKHAAPDQWMTTAAGESVSGAKTPRFTRERVEKAIESLKERIKEINKDSKAPFRITHAAAFGDFLLKDRARVQAADVGIELTSRHKDESDLHSASFARTKDQFMKQLREKTAPLLITSYSPWMTQRSHVICYDR